MLPVPTATSAGATGESADAAALPSALQHHRLFQIGCAQAAPPQCADAPGAAGGAPAPVLAAAAAALKAKEATPPLAERNSVKRKSTDTAAVPQAPAAKKAAHRRYRTKKQKKAALAAATEAGVVMLPPPNVMVKCPNCTRHIRPTANNHWAWTFPSDLRRAASRPPLAALGRSGPSLRCPHCRALLLIPLQSVYNARSRWFMLLLEAEKRGERRGGAAAATAATAAAAAAAAAQEAARTAAESGGSASAGAIASRAADRSASGDASSSARGSISSSAALVAGSTTAPTSTGDGRGLRRSARGDGADGGWAACAICGDRDGVAAAPRRRRQWGGGGGGGGSGGDAAGEPTRGSMIMCDGFGGRCNLAVHPRCYGLRALPQCTWSCNACCRGVLPYDERLRERMLRALRYS